MNLKDFEKRFEKIESIDVDEVDYNEFQESVYELENEVQQALEISFPPEEQELESLLNKINRFKKENDFYDAEEELNRMFPDRGDDDFDEDSTSYESVFGKD